MRVFDSGERIRHSTLTLSVDGVAQRPLQAQQKWRNGVQVLMSTADVPQTMKQMLAVVLAQEVGPTVVKASGRLGCQVTDESDEFGRNEIT